MASATCDSASDAWHSVALRIAAVYNVFWGLCAILVPGAMFRFFAVDAIPEYNVFLQWIGILVAACGIGFWCASKDPNKHWPIVLVGFLTKVFGPMGLPVLLTFGRFSTPSGLAILTIDMTCAVVFASILVHARRACQTARSANRFGYDSPNLRNKSRRRTCSHVEVTASASRDTRTLARTFTVQE